MAKETSKQEYHTPKLERYGTLSELTEAGGNDTKRDILTGGRGRFSTPEG